MKTPTTNDEPSDAIPAHIKNGDGLINQIRLQRNTLPKRLKTIADFIIEQPIIVALHSIPELAKLMEVPPSTLVRFGKALGFSGFVPMQKLLRDKATGTKDVYQKRISNFPQQEDDAEIALGHIAEAFFSSNINALQSARSEIRLDQVHSAIKDMSRASVIGIMGHKRAFPLASYLFYGLSQIDCRPLLIDSLGGMEQSQVNMLRSGDVLIVISFAPYSSTSLSIASQAFHKGVRVIVLTDDPTGAISEVSHVTIPIYDANLHDIRSIAATATLIQVLFVGLGMSLSNNL
ncbi:MurR/RpiR family transcriptional regulator [Ahrensia kielensis]|uniref:MurR/RpiR family transcriptional regulator n=1 Tax=Ahrensia kielensis TaxID=76980 RepID=A0ABU9T1G8_9HYPH